MWISVTIINTTINRCADLPAAPATNEHIVNAIETPVAKGDALLTKRFKFKADALLEGYRAYVPGLQYWQHKIAKTKIQ